MLGEYHFKCSIHKILIQFAVTIKKVYSKTDTIKSILTIDKQVLWKTCVVLVAIVKFNKLNNTFVQQTEFSKFVIKRKKKNWAKIISRKQESNIPKAS